MTLATARISLVCLVALGLAACQSADSGGASLSSDVSYGNSLAATAGELSTSSLAFGPRARAQIRPDVTIVNAPPEAFVAEKGLVPRTPPHMHGGKRHFIEFRSRYALSYGHSFVIFGTVDDEGNMERIEVAGLHPASDSPTRYMMGHAVPVPAETGWSDGDLEEDYMTANWRIMLTQGEYDNVVAYIRRLQNSSPVWHAALYNCNAFTADIARHMGFRTPFIWLRPQQFMTQLRQRNGGPNAIGVTVDYTPPA